MSARIPHEIVQGIEGKKCTKCATWNPLEHFPRNSRKWDNRGCHCKDCASRRSSAHYTLNRERIKEQHKAYYRDNREVLLSKQRIYREDCGKAVSKKYNENHKEEAYKRRQRWYQSNKEDHLLKVRKYLKEHPEKAQVSRARRRARKLQVEECFTQQDRLYVFKLFGCRCVNCGATGNLEIDHFRPLSKGHALTRKNATLLCRSCNSSKGAKPPEEFFSKPVLKNIYNKLGLEE